MKLQTKIPLKQGSNLIDYDSEIVLLGSCFSEHIGALFSEYQFQTVQNPFGILFHPKAIEQFIKRALNDYRFEDRDVLFHNERWHCLDAHSRVSSSDKELLIENLNAKSVSAKTSIFQATHIILTLGTARAYRFNETGQIVANCHKLPQHQFSKSLFEVEAVKQSLLNILDLIRSVNQKANIIFSVSPIRHLKDGFVENMQSKAHLIAAIHHINADKVSYFPAYELMIDELRDYRFYAEDMIHPNKTAISYIWDRFKSAWLSPKTEKTMKAVLKIQKGLRHKPFNEDSEAHQEFLQNLEAQKVALQKRYKHIKF